MKILLIGLCVFTSIATFASQNDNTSKDTFCYCDLNVNMVNQYNLYRVSIVSSDNASAQKFETLVDMFTDRNECVKAISSHPSCK